MLPVCKWRWQAQCSPDVLGLGARHQRTITTSLFSKIGNTVTFYAKKGDPAETEHGDSDDGGGVGSKTSEEAGT